MPAEKKKRPSLNTVAEAAGVNYVYTQRILAGSTKYPKETMDKVFKAAEEIGILCHHFQGPEKLEEFLHSSGMIN